MLAMLQSRVVFGRLVDVIPQPLDDRHVTMQLVFEYPLKGTLEEPELIALGWGRYQQNDAARAIPKEDWDETVARYVRDIEHGQFYPVIFNAEDPYTTARVETDQASIWQFTVGIACIATPSCCGYHGSWANPSRSLPALDAATTVHSERRAVV